MNSNHRSKRRTWQASDCFVIGPLDVTKKPTIVTTWPVENRPTIKTTLPSFAGSQESIHASKNNVHAPPGGAC
ncbi:hypothetical protein, partial [Escherichia coli]|uniref:hypothetical protein n=1 Tax=Escherichia coli TaxID=562 RepID=UPI001BFC4BC6